MKSVTASGESVSVYAVEEAASDLIVDIAVSAERLCSQAREAADKAGVPILSMVVGQDDLAQAYRTLARILGKPRM